MILRVVVTIAFMIVVRSDNKVKIVTVIWRQTSIMAELIQLIVKSEGQCQ